MSSVVCPPPLSSIHLDLLRLEFTIISFYIYFCSDTDSTILSNMTLRIVNLKYDGTEMVDGSNHNNKLNELMDEACNSHYLKILFNFDSCPVDYSRKRASNNICLVSVALLDTEIWPSKIFYRNELGVILTKFLSANFHAREI